MSRPGPDVHFIYGSGLAGCEVDLRRAERPSGFWYFRQSVVLRKYRRHVVRWPGRMAVSRRSAARLDRAPPRSGKTAASVSRLPAGSPEWVNSSATPSRRLREPCPPMATVQERSDVVLVPWRDTSRGSTLQMFGFSRPASGKSRSQSLLEAQGAADDTTTHPAARRNDDAGRDRSGSDHG